MGIPAKYWIDLGEELKQFTMKCKEGETTFPEYLDIEQQKYSEFVEKYSSFIDNYEEFKSNYSKFTDITGG